MPTFASLVQRIFSRTPVRQRLSGAESEQNLLTGVRSLTAPDRDRLVWDRQEILEQALEAWRVNPLARRIVGLTSQYVVGGGIQATSTNPQVDEFIGSLWNHRLNRFDVRLIEWCDELTRTGNLFVLMSTDAQGFSYFRTIPAQSIDRIESAPNDVEQTLAVYPKPTLDNPDPQPWRAFNPDTDSPPFETVVLHYTINRPAGAQWGESDLAPMLKWFSRYANWLEDRARLNRYRNAFLFVVKGQYLSEADRIRRQQALNAAPPPPGSILVCDAAETWEVIHPQLQSAEAGEDGLALKKMLAAGSGIPLHFLAEPESSTRTTAESAGGPTCRHFEQRQKIFTWIVRDVLCAALHRRSFVAAHIPSPYTPGEKKAARHCDPAYLLVSGGDISSRDNASLAMAAASMVQALARLRDRKLIDDREFLRVLYRFAGESMDVEELLRRGRASEDPTLAGELASQPSAVPASRRTKKNRGVLQPALRLLHPDTGDLKPGAFERGG